MDRDGKRFGGVQGGWDDTLMPFKGSARSKMTRENDDWQGDAAFALSLRLILLNRLRDLTPEDAASAGKGCQHICR